MQYTDFDQIKEIGSGGYATVYTANYKRYRESFNMRQAKPVVLKRFKKFDEMTKLFISEVINNW